MSNLSLQHYDIKNFFNEVVPIEIIEELWNLKSDIKTYLFIDYKVFDINVKYKQNFSLIKFNKTPTQEDWKNFEGQKKLPTALEYMDKYDIQSLSNGEDFLFYSTTRNIRINDIAEHISIFNQELASDLLCSFHIFAAEESSDVEHLQDNIWMQQKSMQKYLLDHEVIVKSHEIDFDPNNEESLDEWYSKVDELNKDEPREFHYSTPFIMNDCYVIQNTGSSHFYIYKSKDENSGSWYLVDRSFESQNFKEKYKDYLNSDKIDMGEIGYYAHTDVLDAIEYGCNEWSLILEFKDKKIIKCLPEMATLNLLQNSICETLIGEKQLSYITSEPITFSHKVEAYKKVENSPPYLSNKINSVEAFLRFIREVDFERNFMYHRSLYYFEPHNLESFTCPTDKKEKEHFNSFLETTLSSTVFNNLKDWPENDKKDIVDYISKYIEPLLEDIPILKQYIKNIDLNLNKNNNNNNIKKKSFF